MSHEFRLLRARCEMEALLVEKLRIQIDHCKLMKEYDMVSEESLAEFQGEIDRLCGELKELAEKLRKV